MDLTITLNGRARQLSCQPGETLLALLRREGCFSVRFGSGTGETGAAAVLLDGRLCRPTSCWPRRPAVTR